MLKLLSVMLLLLMVFPCRVYAQEGTAAAETVSSTTDDVMSVDDMTDAAVKALIGIVFAWLAKQAVGKKWTQALLDGLEVGVNEAWETYVKPKKQGNRTLSEEDKAKARVIASEKGKAVMGIGARILLAAMPQSKIASLISGIVNRRKKDAAVAGK